MRFHYSRLKENKHVLEHHRGLQTTTRHGLLEAAAESNRRERNQAVLVNMI